MDSYAFNSSGFMQLKSVLRNSLENIRSLLALETSLYSKLITKEAYVTC